MAEEKSIKFVTKSTILSDNSLSSLAFSTVNYPDTTSSTVDKLDEPDIYSVELADEVKTQDAVSAMEGELITALNISKANISIDINGNLLILHESSDKYSLNSDGELIYTF